METHRIGFQKGAVIPFVLIVFVVATITAAAIFSLFNVNLKQTISQERHIQSYYCALTGLDLGTAALLMPTFQPDGSPGPTLLDEFRSDPYKTPLTDTFMVTNVSVIITIQSTNSVFIKPDSPSGSTDQWVCVEAVGTYIDGNNKGFTTTGRAWYRADDPEVTQRDFS